MPHNLSEVDERIPVAARKSFSLLSGEVLWLKDKWVNYNFLFGHSPERIALLNEAGGFLWYVVDHLFVDDFILSLSRLMENEANGKNENLVVWKLISSLDQSLHEALIKNLKRLHHNLHDKTEALRRHRDKRVAHRDLPTVLTAESGLPPVTRQLILDSLEEAEEFIEVFQFHFTQVTTLSYHGTLETGASPLLGQLVRARAYRVLEADGTIAKGYWRQHYSEPSAPIGAEHDRH